MFPGTFSLVVLLIGLMPLFCTLISVPGLPGEQAQKWSRPPAEGSELPRIHG